MRKTKVYSMLEHFDKYEQNRCRKYIISPYFNSDETLVKLYEIILEDINTDASNEFTKEQVWNRLNCKKAFDDVRLRKYFSDLLKLIEGYLVQEMFNNSALQKANTLLEAIKEKKYEPLHRRAVRNIKSKFQKSNNKSAVHFYHKYKFEDTYNDLANFNLHRDLKGNYEEISYNLDQFYIAEKLRIYLNTLVRQSSHSYDLKFIAHIDTFFEEEDITYFEPVVQVYYLIFKSYQNPEEDQYYVSSKAALLTLEHHLTLEESYHLYVALINYCITKINVGKNQYFKELFDLYSKMIENESIFFEGYLSPWHFKNIILSALRLSEFNWGIEFIEKYSRNLPVEFRDNAVTFNLARIYFEKKEYDKVISLLREVEYDDMSYNINSKTMLLMTYYDTEEIEPLYSLMDSFRVYLNRHNEIPEQRKNYYKNLIKFTKRLTKILPNDQKVIDKLKKEIEQTPDFKVKWLNEKIAALEGR